MKDFWGCFWAVLAFLHAGCHWGPLGWGQVVEDGGWWLGNTVIVDIGLPDGDGFGLTEQLVALPSAPRVVLISTDADAGNGAAARRVGAVGFLPKDELLGGVLQRLLEG